MYEFILISHCKKIFESSQTIRFAHNELLAHNYINNSIQASNSILSKILLHTKTALSFRCATFFDDLVFEQNRVVHVNFKYF